MGIGRYGIWSPALRTDGGTPDTEVAEVTEAVRDLERLGYDAVWVGGSSSVGDAAALVEATSALTVATGILSIWQHDARSVAAAHTELTAKHPGRFLLGLGVSHAPLAGDAYRKPYSAMVRYLDELDAAGVPEGERVLAALGPKMLKLASDRAAGAHPYLVTPEHTAKARAALGPDALLAPEVKVVLDADPVRARAAARAHLARYLALPNYTANLERLGFTARDFEDGGSDALVDALFAWGGPQAVRERTDAFFSAGAGHLALQVVPPADADPAALPREGWRELADVLGLRGAA
ncbi:TIGR03620 family F420-dependent LLM class oxidoreductase [Streptomyces sp. ICBB 8177]|uniref:TIGR03620 family F420-dependent LLM class oxidoreductase n=1 Tax=Streptomyces sp. ICBB 8177 TaxID=563922 RepID=UPI000D68457D|nr:TIGR03620 family F420-dependent LLM class oxidoreductase [Streptomyces sp. ICBB 8177]PWI41094.1 LLM class F420-dependent oxidoreductase [Streptomyces sp. ICBB 8177]